MSKGKVLHVMQCTNLGGMEQSAYLLMEGMKKEGFEIQVISLHPLGPGKSVLEALGIPAIGFPYRGKFGLLSHHMIHTEIINQNPDMVIVTGPSVSSCLAVLALKDIPKVLCSHYHHGSSILSRLKWRLFYEIFARDYDVVTYLTEFISKEANQIYPKLFSKSEVVPAPITDVSLPTLAEKKAARHRLGIPENALVLGNAGWLIKRKRFDILLRVAALLKSNIPDLHVVIAGEGNQKSYLLELASSLNLDTSIHWLGWEEDLSDFYVSLDLLLFNSEADALGRTPLEAMAYGIPVVASVLYGGLVETISNGQNGYLLDEHNVTELSKRCALLLTNREFAKDLGLKGRKTVEEKHSETQYVSRYLDILQNLTCS